MYDDRSDKRRACSAIPSSRTSMKTDDLLTISSTNIKHSCYKMVPLHKGLRQGSKHVEQEIEQRIQKDDIPTMMTDNIKVVLRRHSRPEQKELPALPEANNKQDGKHFNLTCTQSVMKYSDGKLSPLIGEYSKLPIGTLNGNSFSLTCKNNAIKSS